MSIRKREWVTPNGKNRSAYVVDYFDAKGVRRNKQFRTKREAEDWAAETRVELKQGTHVADGASVTVAEAAKLWIADCEARDDDERLEESTLQQYRQHVDLHIEPYIGTRRLNEITAPAVRALQDQLRDAGRSAAMRRKVVTSLGSILADAVDRGLTARNPVQERKRRRKRKPADRHAENLEVGRDIPSPAEIRVILHGAAHCPAERGRRGYRRAILTTAALTGMRISELRGLTWPDVDLVKATITVRQRADQWGKIGSPKAAASRRTIPLPPLVVNTLKEWRLACPRRDTGKKDAAGESIKELHYVFPNGKGRVESQQNIVKRHWHPVQVAAGVSVPVLDDDGKPVQEPVLDDEGKPVIGNNGEPIMRDVTRAKYSGFHTLRHFFCSWCAAPRPAGCGLPLKTVQVRMGHSTLAMTADRYGHLFPSTDDADVLAAGERALMGA
jgi:integrase